MDLLQAVLSAQGGGAVNELARNFGLNQSQATAAVEHLLPALAAGLKKNTATPAGLEGLMGALASGGHGRYFDDVSRLGSADTIRDGNGILGHILGSKDVSRQVAAQAAAQTGIGADVLKQMLPVLATLAMGALSKQTAAVRPGAGATNAGAGGLLGMLAPMLDSDRDGSVADDVMGMLGKFLR